MNVSRLERPVHRIEFDDGGRTTTVEFDNRLIYVGRKKWHIELGTSTRLLHQLSTTISPMRANDPGAARDIRGSWLWLLGAIVVFFSDYNFSIPLLAPALLLVWLIIFALNIRGALPRRWLAVNDDWGTLVVRIRAPDDEGSASSQHDSFARALSKAIETAKQKEYGLADKA